MSNAKISVQEGALLNLIEELGSLAWRKYQQRFPDVWVNNAFRQEDHSGLTGRWEVSTPAQAARAQKMLDELGVKNIAVKVVKNGG